MSSVFVFPSLLSVCVFISSCLSVLFFPLYLFYVFSFCSFVFVFLLVYLCFSFLSACLFSFLISLFLSFFFHFGIFVFLFLSMFLFPFCLPVVFVFVKIFLSCDSVHVFFLFFYVCLYFAFRSSYFCFLSESPCFLSFMSVYIFMRFCLEHKEQQRDIDKGMGGGGVI